MNTDRTVTALLLDTETTGMGKQDQIIEYAHTLFKIDKATGIIIEILEEYSAFQEPTVPINPFAQQTHGIRAEQLIGHTLDLTYIESCLQKAQFIFAHNMSFDKRFYSAQHKHFVVGFLVECGSR